MKKKMFASEISFSSKRSCWIGSSSSWYYIIHLTIVLFIFSFIDVTHSFCPATKSIQRKQLKVLRVTKIDAPISDKNALLLDSKDGRIINESNENALEIVSTVSSRRTVNQDVMLDCTDHLSDVDGKEEKASRLASVSKAAASFSRKSSRRLSEICNGRRKVANATKTRKVGMESMTKLTDAIRKAAVAHTNGKNTKSTTEQTMLSTPRNVRNTASLKVSNTAINSVIEDMIQSSNQIGLAEIATDENVGILERKPLPGTILIIPPNPSKDSSFLDNVTVRVAKSVDDLCIASLRLSLFSDFSAHMRQAFCSRSCHVLDSRRNQGAACVVATIPIRASDTSDRTDIIVGTAECSIHEFYGTSLGESRLQDSILYITEVAVSPTIRRQGIGSKLMKAIDEFAKARGVETIYLHVDVANEKAYSLYEKAGYKKVVSDDFFYKEFTKSLNLHDGATKGRNHYLMHKNMRQPTWLSDVKRKIDSSNSFKMNDLAVQ